MHPPRVPIDFEIGWNHIAGGDTGTFWFGLLLLTGFSWSLWRGRRHGWHGSAFGTATRDQSDAFRAITILHVPFLVIGAYMVVCGLIGLTPFSFGF